MVTVSLSLARVSTLSKENSAFFPAWVRRTYAAHASAGKPTTQIPGEDMTHMKTIPRAGKLPGTGGIVKHTPEDFRVAEVALYEPEGEGSHAYLWVEKRDVAGGQLIARVARAFGCREGDVGSAGTKDRRAVTQQWLSVPDADGHIAIPDEGLEIGAGVRVIKGSRHSNKLRTGHLRGNRFDILLRDVVPDALERATAICEILERRGMANYYGPQRFGRDGQNVEAALSLLRGEKRRHGRFQRKMVASALQAWLFNEALRARMERGELDRVIDGDVMKKRDSGGIFVADEVEAEQTRFEAGETVHTGPMFGHKMRRAERAAAEREGEVLTTHGLSTDDFRAFGKLGRGTRRANLAFVEELVVEQADDGLRLRFFLPKGSYATVLLDEVMGFGCR